MVEELYGGRVEVKVDGEWWPALVSRNTRPGEKLFRITVFRKRGKGLVVEGHVDLSREEADAVLGGRIPEVTKKFLKRHISYSGEKHPGDYEVRIKRVVESYIGSMKKLKQVISKQAGMVEGFKTGERRSREEALKFVEEMTKALESMGLKRENIYPCGSIRRLKPTVGDLDIVLDDQSVTKSFYARFKQKMIDEGHEVSSIKDNGDKMGMGDVHCSVRIDGFLVELKRAYPGCLGAMLLFATGCLKGDTKVALLDGRDLCIGELAREFEEGIRNWVYSIKDGVVIPNEVLSCHKSVVGAQMVRVTLDDGGRFEVTPEHKVMLRGGAWKEAASLVEGESLMPLYRRTTEDARYRFNKKGYTEVYVPALDDYRLVHRLVREGYSMVKGLVTHHRDFNSRNNNPTNLQGVGWKEHREIHLAHLGKLWEDPDFRGMQGRLTRERNRRNWENPAYREKMRKVQETLKGVAGERMSRVIGELWKSPEFALAQKVRMRCVWDDEKRRKKAARALSDFHRNNPGFNRETQGKAAAAALSRRGEKADGPCPYCGRSWETNSELWRHKARCPKKGEVVLTNHKVKRVELVEVSDGYDVVLTENHNFGLACGVFVHNSGDFNMGMRGFAKKMGYALSQKGLIKREEPDKVIVSDPEEAIFKELGVPFVEPKDRSEFRAPPGAKYPRYREEPDEEQSIPSEIWDKIPDPVKEKLKAFEVPKVDDKGVPIPGDFLWSKGARQKYYKQRGTFKLPDEFKLDRYADQPELKLA